MRPKARIILLATLPLLFWAIMAFAKAVPFYVTPLWVSENGREFIFQSYPASHFPKQRRFFLNREDDGLVETTVEQLSVPPQSYPRCVATNSVVVVFAGDRVLFRDSESLKKLAEKRFIEFPDAFILTGATLSANEEFLFCTLSTVKSPLQQVAAIIDLKNFDLSWFETIQLNQSYDSYFAVQECVLIDQSDTVRFENTIQKFVRISDFKFVGSEIHSIENGSPEAILSGNGLPFVSANGDRTVTSVVRDGVDFLKRESKESFRLKSSQGNEVEIVGQSRNRLVLRQGPALKVFDWKEMRLVSEIPPIGYVWANCLMSTEGHTAARNVRKYNLTWREYLESGCQSDSGYVEVLDTYTGKTIRIVWMANHFWYWAVAAFAGSILWSLLWVWSGQHSDSTAKSLGAVTALVLLWFLFFGLRYVYGGNLPDGSPGSGVDIRPSGLAFKAIGSSLFGTMTFGIALSRISFARQILTANCVTSLFVLAAIEFWKVVDLPLRAFPVEVVSVSLGALVLASIASRFRITFLQGEWEKHLDEPNSSQFALVDLLMLPIAVALVLAISRTLFEYSNLAHARWIAFKCIPLVTVIGISFWTGLSRSKFGKWLWLGILVGCVLACLSNFQLWNEVAKFYVNGNNGSTTAWDEFSLMLWREVAIVSGAGLFTFLMMLWLKRGGWCLTRIKPVTH